MNIERINELAKKSREVGLTDEEKKEQEILRREYIDAFKRNIRAQLGDPEEFKKLRKENNKKS